MSDDNERDRLTRAEILQRFGWQPGEREEFAREMAERQARIDRERIAAETRQAERQQRPLVAEKTYAVQKREEAAEAASWRKYINEKLDRRDRALIRGLGRSVGGALRDEELRRERGDDALRLQFHDVCARFDDHPRHDVIDTLRQRIDELQQRLDRLEAKAAPGIRRVG